MADPSVEAARQRRARRRWWAVSLQMAAGRGPDPEIVRRVAAAAAERRAPTAASRIAAVSVPQPMSLPSRSSTLPRVAAAAVVAALLVGSVAVVGWLSPAVAVAPQRAPHTDDRSAARYAGTFADAATVDDVRQLAARGGVEALRLRGADPALLAAVVARLPRVRHLDVVAAGAPDRRADRAFPDRGFALLAILRELRSLRITGLRVDAAGVDRLGSLPRLQRLELHEAVADGATLRALARLRGLAALVCTGPVAAEPADYAALAALSQLRELDLSVRWGSWFRALERATPPAADLLRRRAAVVDGEVLAALATLPRLRRLALALRPGVTDPALGRLAAAPELVDLTLTGCAAVSDAGLATLPPELRRLAAAACPEVGRDLPVERWQQLRTLVLSSNANLDDAQVARIVELPELRELDLRGCGRISAAGGEQLAAAVGLRDLLVCGSPWLSDEVLRELARLPQLQRLGIAGFGQSRVTGRGLRALASLEHLEVLIAPGIAAIDVDDLRALAVLPLRELDLSDNRIAFDERTRDAAALRALWPDAEVELAEPPR